MKENSWVLARYGAICQQNGLVPVIEPEVRPYNLNPNQESMSGPVHVIQPLLEALDDQALKPKP